MKIIKSITEKLRSKVASNAPIGIFVSPNSMLEVVQFDTETKEVLKHGKTELPYDLIARQVNQVHLLESGLEKLFEELELPLNSSVRLSLPTVLMSHQTLPTVLDNEEIRTALISETERNYIFKKYEPVISWNKIEVNPEKLSQYLIYSAIQKEQIDSIEEITNKLGLKLVAIDSSYAALIRGVTLTGIADEEINNDLSWCALMITPNSFVVISLKGNKIIEISEEPLAVKSFNPEDIYPNIASYSMGGILNKIPEHIIIISESDDVSAEVLSTYLDLTCKVSFIEENKFNKQSLFSGNIALIPNKPNTVSLEAIGSACWDPYKFSTNFNFIEKEGFSPFGEFGLNLFGRQFELTPKLLEYVLLGIIGFVFVTITSVSLACWTINSGLEKTVRESYVELNKVKQIVEEQSKTQQPVQANISDIIYSVYEKNKNLLQSYSAIGQVIPEKLWIEHFELHDNLTTNIKGKAYSVEDIINYYQGLNKTAKFSNFKIASIKAGSQDNFQQSNNSEITIIPSGENSGTLPTLPNLPNLSSQKYYEFAFGDNGSAPNPEQPPGQEPSAPESPPPAQDPSRPPMTGP